MTFTLIPAPSFGARALRSPVLQPFSRPSIARSLGASFQGLCRWLVDGTPVGLKPMQQISLRHSQLAPLQVVKAQQPAAKPAIQAANACLGATRAVRGLRAVRVVRVQESGQSRTSVGRMVISGRMADVCAELDRLAAQEATLH
jgi:hypothetical protein